MNIDIDGKFKCVVRPNGEYLTEGVEYNYSIYGNTVDCRRVSDGVTGTYIQLWQLEMYINKGQVVVIK